MADDGLRQLRTTLTDTALGIPRPGLADEGRRRDRRYRVMAAEEPERGLGVGQELSKGEIGRAEKAKSMHDRRCEAWFVRLRRSHLVHRDLGPDREFVRPGRDLGEQPRGYAERPHAMPRQDDGPEAFRFARLVRGRPRLSALRGRRAAIKHAGDGKTGHREDLDALSPRAA
jgi:hypothetical protein